MSVCKFQDTDTVLDMVQDTAPRMLVAAVPDIEPDMVLDMFVQKLLSRLAQTTEPKVTLMRIS